MWEMVAQSVVTAASEMHWHERYARATPEIRLQMETERERARKEANEERRHQEIVAAIQAKNNWSSYSSTSSPLCTSHSSDMGLGLALGIPLGIAIGLGD